MHGNRVSGNCDSLGLHSKAGNLQHLALGSLDFKKTVVVEVTPVLVPWIRTKAPATGAPFSSWITPFTVCWANAWRGISTAARSAIALLIRWRIGYWLSSFYKDGENLSIIPQFFSRNNPFLSKWQIELYFSGRRVLISYV